MQRQRTLRLQLNAADEQIISEVEHSSAVGHAMVASIDLNRSDSSSDGDRVTKHSDPVVATLTTCLSSRGLQRKTVELEHAGCIDAVFIGRQEGLERVYLALSSQLHAKGYPIA